MIANNAPMNTNTPPSQIRSQVTALLLLVVIYACLALIYYLTLPDLSLALPAGTTPGAAQPAWSLGLANAGFILVFYSLAGLAGLWFARRLGLPGVYRPQAGWRAWFVYPLVIGLALGALIVLLDRLLAPAIATALGLAEWQGFSHPPFPQSILASATAALGEEILFRMFVLGLWAFLLNLLLRRWNATPLALWIGNIIAALAVSASHLPAAMLLTGTTSPADLPAVVIAEIFLLNGILGLFAGEHYLRVGLVAAMGVHFWADIVWHVIYPLVK
jgi:membrane protease YdiL (CAAX protease family)